MNPRIETTAARQLVGLRCTMSWANNKLAELWGRFMHRRREITHTCTRDLISLVIYQPTHFTDFKPTNEFERWAAVEVSQLDDLPDGMESLELPGGLYAVFDYKGSSTDPAIFQYIFGTWLPASDYMLDDRPHFEVLGDKYKNNDAASEEEIWIPVRWKSSLQ